MDGAKQLVSILVQGSMILMIMSIAMECRFSDVLEQIRRPKLLFRAIVAGNIVVPLVAVVLVLLLPLSHAVTVGLILMAVSPLAPLVPGNALKAGAHRPYVIALYTLLIVLAIVIVPLTISILNATFGAQAHAPLTTIAQVVVISAVLPIGLGLAMAALWPDLSRRLAPIFTLISNIILALFVVALLWVAGPEFLSMIGNGTIIAFALTSGSGVIAGHLLGGKDPGNRGALALAAAIRHPGIAAAIGHASGADTHALAATFLFLLVGVVVTSLYQLWLKRTNASGHATA